MVEVGVAWMADDEEIAVVHPDEVPVGPAEAVEAVGPAEAAEAVGPAEAAEAVGPAEAAEAVGPAEAAEAPTRDEPTGGTP
jgi:hypothetical protein